MLRVGVAMVPFQLREGKEMYVIIIILLNRFISACGSDIHTSTW